MYEKNLIEYVPKMVEELTAQLEKDQQRWGDTWKTRPVEGQEMRMFARFHDYEDQFKQTGAPVPYMKIIGEALICWVREKFNQ